MQFHIWSLIATKQMMIDYNQFEIDIKNLMRIFYKLSVLSNNSQYLLPSNTSGYEIVESIMS